MISSDSMSEQHKIHLVNHWLQNPFLGQEKCYRSWKPLTNKLWNWPLLLYPDILAQSLIKSLLLNPGYEIIPLRRLMFLYIQKWLPFSVSNVHVCKALGRWCYPTFAPCSSQCSDCRPLSSRCTNKPCRRKWKGNNLHRKNRRDAQKEENDGKWMITWHHATKEYDPPENWRSE